MECLMRVGKLSANSIAEKHYETTLRLMEVESYMFTFIC